MNNPIFSVVIPAYKQAEFLGETIRSVLAQTYPHLEVIVVNDASPDHTGEIVAQFDDPRVRTIVHDQNRGLPAARNTGMRAATGEFIALLDADDLFHPEKLQAHVDFLKAHPIIGVTYNNRFEFNHSAATVRRLHRPPQRVDLSDIVMGYPYAPSDMVIRRGWAMQVDFFDEQYIYGGEDLDFPSRLALAGCQFANVDRALNFRRYHSGRLRRDIPERLDDVFRSLHATFTDPRCPEEVLKLQDAAFATNYLVYLWHALDQEREELAHKCAREAVRLDPSMLEGTPCRFIESFAWYSIADEGRDHEVLLRQMFRQLPPEMDRFQSHLEWAIARGFLAKATRAMIWNRIEDGSRYFSQAKKLGAQLDKRFLHILAHELNAYELEFGLEKAQRIFRRLITRLREFGTRAAIRQFEGTYAINCAFGSYQRGDYKRVPAQVAQAALNNPSVLVNRGVLAILLRSIPSSYAQQRESLH